MSLAAERSTEGLFCALAGRILLSLVYAANGFGLIGAFSDVTAIMAAKGVPIPDALLLATIALWLIGSAYLILGWTACPAVMILFLVTIPVAFVFHQPWTADAAQFPNELNHFVKNLAILGGLLLLVAFGASPHSLQKRQAREARHGNSRGLLLFW
jgi:putative oxidoreductase